MKLKRIEVAVLIGLLAALLVGGANAQGNRITESVIRLHVVANSDSEEDQALKLLVRDRVLELTTDLGDDLDQATKQLNDSLEEIQAQAQELVYEMGYDYPVAVRLTTEALDTRKYDSFSLPAGEYLALRVTIGSGEGKNWWCVVFPPICMASCSQELTAQAMASGLDPDDIALITGEDQVYVFKFKLIELVQSIKMLYNQ